MKAFLGIDGGGTKTRACLIDSHLDVIAKGESTGSNPNNVGEREAAKTIAEAAREAIRATSSITVQSACLGIAGIATKDQSERLENQLRTFSVFDFPIRITHDIEIALEAGIEGRPGIGIISGTGSSCYGRGHEGKTARASGRNLGEDDPGSGYAIGLAGIEAGLVESDSGRRESVASLATKVMTLANSGNEEARGILQRNAKSLIKLINQVLEELELPEPVEVVLAGGLIQNDTLYEKILRNDLESTVTKISLRRPIREPAEAAARFAYQAWID